MQNESVHQEKHSWLRTIAIGRNPKVTLIRVAVLVVVCTILFKYVLLPVRVDGPSMLPTYKDNSVNLINRLAYRNADPQRGDIVAVRYSGTSMMLMKRVVALPGETIEFVNGRILIDGRYLEEPYLKNPCDWNVKPNHSTMRADEYYVVGDNRSMPYQLHDKGGAKRERILGKVML